MNYIFILTEPSVPENIGAAARAIKTMGFSELRLVKPANHLADEAKWLAHGSNDVLEKARIFDSFEEAIAGIDFLIATTAKNRSSKFDYYTPEEAKNIVIDKGVTIQNVGIVFGREESGLTNQEVKLCDIAASIPLTAPYPSINLAQSVMIFSYIFSSVNNLSPEIINKQNNHSLLKQRTVDLLEKIGIAKSGNLHGRILERLATLKENDISLLLSVINRIKK